MKLESSLADKKGESGYKINSIAVILLSLLPVEAIVSVKLIRRVPDF